MVQPKTRNRIIDSLLALAAERPWDEVTLPALAERAGVTLAALRGAYDGRLAVLADFVRRIGRARAFRRRSGAGGRGAARAALRRAVQPLRGARSAQAGDPQPRRGGAPRPAPGARAEPHRHRLDGLDADGGRHFLHRGAGACARAGAGARLGARHARLARRRRSRAWPAPWPSSTSGCARRSGAPCGSTSSAESCAGRAASRPETTAREGCRPATSPKDIRHERRPPPRGSVSTIS